MDLVERLIRDATEIFADFRSYWATHGPDFSDEDGNVSAGSVLLILARFAQEHASKLNESHWSRLAKMAQGYFAMGEPMRGLLGSCLIDPLERPPAEREVRRYFDRTMLRHYHFAGTVPSASRGDLLDAAWEVARNLHGYGQYGGTARALQALARRCPAFSPQQYANALEKGRALHDAAVKAVHRNSRRLFRETNIAESRFPDFRDLARALRRQHAGFRVATCQAAAAWAFYWHHLR